MDKMYVTLVNISTDACHLDKYILFYTDDCSVNYEVMGLEEQYLNLCEELKNSYVECELERGKGIIVDSCNKSVLLNHSGKSYLINQRNFKATPRKKLSMVMDGYTVSSFLFCLNNSGKYVEIVSKHLSCTWSILCKEHNSNFKLSKLQIQLAQPHKHLMDLTWAKMACRTIYELKLLQGAMSWLSTLGGAFSALGEEQEKCAKTAGDISMDQMRIALKLGDNIVISQCKLYFSLSLIQRGYCKHAKKIILEQYCMVKNSIVPDRKTLNMCRGVWARLKYEIQKRKGAKV